MIKEHSRQHGTQPNINYEHIHDIKTRAKACFNGVGLRFDYSLILTCIFLCVASVAECVSFNSEGTPSFRSSVCERVSCRGVCLFWRRKSDPPELCCTPEQREKEVAQNGSILEGKSHTFKSYEILF